MKPFRHNRISALSSFFVFTLFLLALAPPAFAATVNSSTTFHINNTAGGGDCTARSIGAWNASTLTCTLTSDITMSAAVDGIDIDSSGITLDGAGHTLTGSGNYTVDNDGVFLTGLSGVTVKNLSVADFRRGIHLVSSTGSTVSGNTVSSNGIGSPPYSGIYLDASTSSTVSGNTANSNGHAGIYLDNSSGSCSGNTISGNTANSNANDGIHLDTCPNSIISGNTANLNNTSQGGTGIYLWASDHSTITNNTANQNNRRGIFLGGSTSNCNISGNTVKSNIDALGGGGGFGFDIYQDSSNNSFSGNTVESNGSGGINDVENSGHNTIQNNAVSSNQDGIDLAGDSACIVSGNTISSNKGTGINVTSSWDTPSTNNQVYHNNFVSNATQASDSSSSIGSNLNGVKFTDSSHGWAVGYGGVILATTNGGGTWTPQTSGTTNDLYGVSFADQNHGWAVGYNGTILATSNGGSTWTTQTSGTTNPLLAASFADSSHGWAVGGSGTILVTSNGGSTWSPQTSGTTSNLFAIDFLSASDGWAVGGSGTILATANGGSTWSPQTSGTTNDLLGVSFTDSSHGWAVGVSGTILATTNGGGTWTRQTSGTTNTLFGVSFADSSHGWAVGWTYNGGSYSGSSTLLATSNGGATWSPQDTSRIDWLYGVSATDSNHAWAVGYRGTMIVTSNGGATWSPQTASTGNVFNLAAPTGGNYWSDFSPSCSDADHDGFCDSPYTFTGGQDNLPLTTMVGGSPPPAQQAGYFWTWYDNVGGDNWVLLANPSSATQNLTYSLSIAGKGMSLPGGGVVKPGQSITPKYPNVIGGPVKATASGGKGIVSQRILWPKGGNSLEEVLGTEQSKLSSDFYWTWYDNSSPGYTNWILVANPGSSSVYYQITIAGKNPGPGSTGTLLPGKETTPTFPGVMNGPVEVKAWTNSGKTTPANIMASQRVLSNGGSAFNEVPGIPASSLSDDYLWTWYDNNSPGYTDWVLVANPGTSSVTYRISIGGSMVKTGTIPAGGRVTPTFPGKINGPVEVTASANVIASQRVTAGPSFEEVPGYPRSDLAKDYNWTWYDNADPGSTNWVLIANPGSSPVTYQIKIAGKNVPRGSGTIPAGGRVTPTFTGLMAGPVEVTASGNVMASQRVTWNGYFNEVLGTVVK